MVDLWITLCYNTIMCSCSTYKKRQLEIERYIMVVDDQISQALNRIADQIEENGETLKRIANHYDGVVPVMTRNAKRAETLAEEQERTFTQGIKDIFRPQEN